MKRSTLHIFWLVSAALILSSCLGSDDTDTASSDCYIQSFSLGMMKRTVHVTKSDGSDSTYTISYSGSYYPMTIDQRANTIVNTDPLPTETRVDSVLATITATGTVTYAYSNADTTVWTAYSSEDSICFSKPVFFRVYAADGSGYRDYAMHLRMCTTNSYEYSWEQLPEVTAQADAQQLRALMWGGKALVLSAYSDGRLLASVGTEGEPFEWETMPCTGAANGILSTLQHTVKTLWMSTTGAALLTSTDGIVWTEMAQDKARTLIAASEKNLYATDADGVYVSEDLGLTWTAMELEEPYSLFPSETTSIFYTQNNANDRVLLAGYNADSGNEIASVWGHLLDFEDSWTYFNLAPTNPYGMPLLQYQSIVTYNDELFTAGGASSKGSAHTALDAFYKSQDGGITWIADEYLTAPTALQGTTAPITLMGTDDHIWLIVGKEVWRACLNEYTEI